FLFSLDSRAQGDHKAAARNYGQVPLSFEANGGQTDPRVRYLARGNGYSLFLTDREAVLALRRKSTAKARGKTQDGNAPAQTDIVRMQLIGAAGKPHVTGADPLAGTVNYFVGSDSSKWRTGVPTYGKVRYANVYPGVDLVYYGNQRQLEYDFVV